MRPWTQEDEDKLRHLMADRKVPRSIIPEILGRGKAAVKNRIAQLGLGCGHSRPIDGWTAEQNATLRRMWHTHSREEVAAAVGRTIAAVSRRAHQFGLGPRKNIVTPEAEQARKAQAVEAAKRGREAQAARRAALENGQLPAPPKPRVENAATVPRNCLRCGRGFQAPTRFIRLCIECRSNTGAIL